MKAVETFFILFFVAIVGFIVFVSAGAKGGQSGGDQTSTILTGLGSGLTNLGVGLETGTRY